MKRCRRRKKSHPGKLRPPDWNTLFAAAGLDLSKLQPATPIWASLAASDVRQAWTGEWPGYNHRPLRVEAAAWHGRPVFFSLTGPWSRPARMPSSEPGSAGDIASRILVAIIILVPILAAVFLARWNFVRGKGDRRGAMRLAIVMFSLQMLLWAFQAHFSSAGNFAYLLVLRISTALLWGGVVWVLYLALEPYVRRYWPQAIISWTRVLAGRWRDPLVGRDVLYGAILGMLFCDIYVLRYHVEARLGAPPATLDADYLGSARIAISAWFWHIPGSISSMLLMFLTAFSVSRVAAEILAGRCRLCPAVHSAEVDCSRLSGDRLAHHSDSLHRARRWSLALRIGGSCCRSLHR